jgi:regulator of protease activity HflC (stomatin/prohibitin superfamily)
MGVLSVVVERHEKVLVVQDGTVAAVLGPGRHRRRRRSSYERVDVRERISTVPAQEVLTADTVTLKVSVAMRWQVVDPIAYTAVADAEAVVYLAVQIALRDELSGRDALDVVRTGRAEVSPALLEAARLAAAGVGISLEDLVIKDIVLPAELRAAYADVLTARQRGQVQLETARAESAALRSMANAAKLLDEHPALARLRLVQAATYGSKLVLDVGGRTGDISSS